ncbi:baculovirus F protein domain-containing protein [Phthorimaea operculella]|nr:baculovirus F protein domain-containing protein [Phthorimaea operculella]
MTIISSTEAYVNITKFRENQTLYFDKAADMLLIKDEWKLVVYYKMEPYWQGNTALHKYIEALDTSCKTIQDLSHCNAILLQLRHGYTELDYYNQLLLTQHMGERTTRTRARRGLINGVGYLANSLFGVLDESFAEQYKKDINMLKENENHIVQLWKNQTSIVEAENNLLKRTEHIMNQQHKTINQHLMTLQNTLQQVKYATQENGAISDFAIGAIIASNVLHNLQETQNALIDTVTDIYQGRFNLHLLTPEQLIDELSTISSKLPKDVALPIDNIHSDLRKLYNLLNIKTRMMREYLIFEIKIPLISRDTYEILQIHSIPKLQETNIIHLLPVSDFIALNMKKDTFIPMTEMDVRACFTQTSTYFCHSKQPEYRIKDDKNLCMMDKQECQYTINKCKNKWQESYAMNTYIYFCCDSCHVKTMCEDRITAHQLTGAGLMTIDYGCLIKTEEFTIHTHKPHTSEVQISADLLSPITISPINHMINISIPHFIINNKTHLELEQETTAIQNKIKDLKENAVLSNDVTFHDIHHYAMIYVLFCIIAIMGIIVAIKRVQCKWKISQASREDPGEVIEVVAAQPEPAVRSARVSALREDPPRSVRARPATGEGGGSANNKRLKDKSTSPVLRKFDMNEDSV